VSEQRRTGQGRFAARVRADLFERPPGSFAALDGVRGLAVLLVVLYHCALFTGCFTAEAQALDRLGPLRFVLAGCWAGVDLFFVLSGFLIGRILLLELCASGGLYYPSFLIRRSLRIFPAYYLVLSFSLLVVSRLEFPLYYFLFGGTTDRAELVSAAWSSYAYVSNYVRPGNEPSLLSWGWSLCVEEHMYLLLPPLLWAAFRWLRPGLRGPLLLACCAAPLLGRALQYVAEPGLELMQGFYYYTHNRVDAMFVGVALAYAHVLHGDALRRAAARAGSLVWIAGLACLALAWTFGGHRDTPFAIVGQFSALALGGALLILNGVALDNAVTRALAHPAWYPLARVSYGMYLIHPFVLFAVLTLLARWVLPNQVGAPLLGAFSAVVLAATWLGASLMFVLFERPLLDLGARWSRRARVRAGRG
jgi:peptidoglycan/LPS O-acetylase OafA/YrhL